MHRRSLLTTWLLAATLAVTASACGSSSTKSAANAPTTTTAAGAAFPATVTGDNGAVAIAAKPTRIVSLSPSATEDLFAIGAGKQVVAVDDQSNYPAEAPHTKLSGFSPNVEAIAGYNPDLVVMSDKSVARELKAIKVPLLVLSAPKGLDQAYAQIDTLGSATGNKVAATTVVDKMKSDIAKTVASVPKPSKPLTYYHELDDTLYTASSHTFIGNVYSLLGLKNIGDAADKDKSGYPQLSAEYLISANPDLVFLADTKCCKQSAATVAQRPGWSGITAVKNGTVLALDDDIASRWGPRVVDLLRDVANEVRKAEAKA